MHDQIVRDLLLAFPRSPVPAGTAGIYCRELSDIPAPQLELAVRHLIRTSTEPWLPSIGAIRRVAAERALDLPQEQDALEQVDARMVWARSGAEDGAPPVHPLVRQALDLVGGFSALRQSDNPGATRGAFLRHYRELRARSVADAQVARALEPGPRRAELDMVPTASRGIVLPDG